jgi:hypothetical protein
MSHHHHNNVDRFDGFLGDMDDMQILDHIPADIDGWFDLRHLSNGMGQVHSPMHGGLSSRSNGSVNGGGVYPPQPPPSVRRHLNSYHSHEGGEDRNGQISSKGNDNTRKRIRLDDQRNDIEEENLRMLSSLHDAQTNKLLSALANPNTRIPAQYLNSLTNSRAAIAAVEESGAESQRVEEASRRKKKGSQGTLPNNSQSSASLSKAANPQHFTFEEFPHPARSTLSSFSNDLFLGLTPLASTTATRKGAHQLNQYHSAVPSGSTINGHLSSPSQSVSAAPLMSPGFTDDDFSMLLDAQFTSPRNGQIASARDLLYDSSLALRTQRGEHAFIKNGAGTYGVGSPVRTTLPSKTRTCDPSADNPYVMNSLSSPSLLTARSDALLAPHRSLPDPPQEKPRNSKGSRGQGGNAQRKTAVSRPSASMNFTGVQQQRSRDDTGSPSSTQIGGAHIGGSSNLSLNLSLPSLSSLGYDSNNFGLKTALYFPHPSSLNSVVLPFSALSNIDFLCSRAGVSSPPYPCPATMAPAAEIPHPESENSAPSLSVSGTDENVYQSDDVNSSMLLALATVSASQPSAVVPAVEKASQNSVLSSSSVDVPSPPTTSQSSSYAARICGRYATEELEFETDEKNSMLFDVTESVMQLLGLPTLSMASYTLSTNNTDKQVLSPPTATSSSSSSPRRQLDATQVLSGSFRVEELVHLASTSSRRVYDIIAVLEVLDVLTSTSLGQHRVVEKPFANANVALYGYQVQSIRKFSQLTDYVGLHPLSPSSQAPNVYNDRSDGKNRLFASEFSDKLGKKWNQSQYYCILLLQIFLCGHYNTLTLMDIIHILTDPTTSGAEVSSLSVAATPSGGVLAGNGSLSAEVAFETSAARPKDSQVENNAWESNTKVTIMSPNEKFAVNLGSKPSHELERRSPDEVLGGAGDAAYDSNHGHSLPARALGTGPSPVHSQSHTTKKKVSPKVIHFLLSGLFCFHFVTAFVAAESSSGEKDI